jgi:hypothetical protein
MIYVIIATIVGGVLIYTQTPTDIDSQIHNNHQ